MQEFGMSSGGGDSYSERRLVGRGRFGTGGAVNQVEGREWEEVVQRSSSRLGHMKEARALTSDATLAVHLSHHQLLAALAFVPHRQEFSNGIRRCHIFTAETMALPKRCNCK